MPRYTLQHNAKCFGANMMVVVFGTLQGNVVVIFDDDQQARMERSHEQTVHASPEHANHLSECVSE